MSSRGFCADCSVEGESVCDTCVESVGEGEREGVEGGVGLLGSSGECVDAAEDGAGDVVGDDGCRREDGGEELGEDPQQRVDVARHASSRRPDRTQHLPHRLHTLVRRLHVSVHTSQLCQRRVWADVDGDDGDGWMG